MNNARRTLYPELAPHRHGHLEVGDGHSIYWEECGNPRGKPAVFVHGGPGAGADARSRRFFDPARYRIFVFDQRGCGRSLPHASLEANTTWHLVADMERLREFLGIDRWLVFGGSWGSTLSLAYAETHPNRVTELVLRGIFLLRRSELKWFYQNPEGAASLFPDLWEKYVAPIPPRERRGMMRAYYRRLTSRSAKQRAAAAYAWSVWEGATSFLKASADYVAKFGDPAYAAAFARIECHYFVNKGFFEREDRLLAHTHRIRHLPCTIVHGRYDVVTPVKNAWDLSRVWPEAELRIVPDAGHAMTEPGIVHELVDATRRHAGLA
jgi:proline iminopeptidase